MKYIVEIERFYGRKNGMVQHLVIARAQPLFTT